MSPAARAQNGPPYRPMNPLARLIKRRKEELEATWKDLAARGGFSSHTVLYALATKPEHKAIPRAETISRLAKALDVPIDVVRQAAIESAGVAVRNLDDVAVPLAAAEDVRIIAAVVGELGEADRAILRDIAEQFARRRRQQDSD